MNFPPPQYFQNTGVNSTRTVRISSRPSNMPIVSSHLAASGKVEKLPAGPMIGPSPGPTLHTAVAAPVRADVESRPISASPRALQHKVMVKKTENGRNDGTITSA